MVKLFEPDAFDEGGESAAWRARVEALAGHMPYPPAPNVWPAVRGRIARPERDRRRLARRLAWAALIVLLLVSVFVAVPELRAAVLQVLRIGAVRIVPFDEPTPATTPDRLPSATPLRSILDLPGETTLAAAQDQLDFRIRLPVYPSDVGAPDRVYLHGDPRPYVTLVWLRDGEAQAVAFSLSIIDSSGFAEKYSPWKEQLTVVNGRTAAWLTGVHALYQESDVPGAPAPLIRRLVQQNVLIWQAGSLTYRLECDLPLDEARRIAESIR